MSVLRPPLNKTQVSKYWHELSRASTSNPPIPLHHFYSRLRIYLILNFFLDFEISRARTTPDVFRLWYQLWQNRQIKTLIKPNGHHLNTSGALA